MAKMKASEKRSIRIVILVTKAEDKYLRRLADRRDKHVTEVIREAASRVIRA